MKKSLGETSGLARQNHRSAPRVESTHQIMFGYVSLALLLIIRIVLADPVANLGLYFDFSVPPVESDVQQIIYEVAYHIYFDWSFIVIGLLIIFNRKTLISINIDAVFISIYFFGGLLYWIYYRNPSGWLALLMIILVYIAYKRDTFRFAKTTSQSWGITMMILIIFIGGVLIWHDTLNIKNLLFVTRSIATQIPFLIVEEFIFRGLLWGVLKNLNWSTLRIVGVQGFLFWLAHSHFVSAFPVYFWLVTPFVSIILGIIVWRSKSLTVSSIAHIVVNYLSALIYMP